MTGAEGLGTAGHPDQPALRRGKRTQPRSEPLTSPPVEGTFFSQKRPDAERR